MADPTSELIRLAGFEDWNPDDVIAEAVAEHAPVARFCLTSGGGDSTVLAHRCREHFDELVHIDTGTAVPGVQDFVREYAEWLGKPLRILEAGDAYEVMVLGGLACRSGDLTPPLGFPGPANHQVAYTRLKERQVEALIRDVKEGHPRTAKIMLLSGTRRHESARRMRTQANRHRCRGAQLWVNPLLDWTDAQMRSYREEHELPISDVSALLHRSGECNCGSFAAPGEREMMRSLWPQWFHDRIENLEERAQAAGLAACRWGERPPDRPIKDGRVVEATAQLDIPEAHVDAMLEDAVALEPDFSPLCSDCVLRTADG